MANKSLPTTAMSAVSELTEPLLLTTPQMAYPYIAAVGSTLSIGAIGNLMIIGAFCVSKEVRVVGNEFILNMAVADLFVAVIADPMCLLGVIAGEEFFYERTWLCHVVASICLTACFCAFLSLGAITLTRYIYIVHNKYFNKIFERNRNILFCFFIWIVAAVMEMPNFLGWGGHGFDDTSHQCIWDRTADMSYTMFLSLFMVLGPLMLMVLAYMHIFWKIRGSKRRVDAHNDKGEINANEKKKLRSHAKSARSIFVVVIAFLICWVPYALAIMIDFQTKMPYWVHLWVTFLAHTHSALNFFIYGITNPKFRSAYGKVLRKADCCGVSYSSDGSTTGTDSTQQTGTRGTESQRSNQINKTTSTDTESKPTKTMDATPRGPYIKSIGSHTCTPVLRISSIESASFGDEQSENSTQSLA